MNCQQCGAQPATVHVTRIVNGEKTDLHLCEACARERGDLEFLLEPKYSIQNLMAGLLGQGVGQMGPSTLTKNQCPQCGLTYTEFAKSGQLGCAECYDTFDTVITPILRRVHGNTRHVGKSIAAVGKVNLKRTIESLRSQLQRAVEEERYEDAARLRDEIREMEKRLARERESR